jgi:hypothetical protein
VPLVSRYLAFNGLSQTEDPRLKGYIRKDGLHPTPLAVQVTVELLRQAGYAPTDH